MSAATQTTNALTLYPRSWGGDTAYTPKGGLYTLLSSIGAAHGMLESQLDYVKKQTRLLTATDVNLENIAADFLGVNFTRTLAQVGGTWVTENDEEYAERIQYTRTAPQVTIAGLQDLIQRWITTYYVIDYVLNVRLMGLDVEGGLDTWGALDGRAVSTPPIPVVTVFDLQSDPIRAAKIPLTASQFCVLLTYGGLLRDGFFLNHTHVGRKDHLLSDKLRTVPPLTSAFDAYVRSIKAVGTVPIYADNRSS